MSAPSSAIKEANIAAVRECLVRYGDDRYNPVRYLSELRARLRPHGFTRTDVDAAVDTLARTGEVSVTATEFGGLLVRLRTPQTSMQ